MPIHLSMDRREALKRLGVGSALVVSAPLLLDSFNVAHAASGIPDPPSGNEAVPFPPLTAKTNSIQIDFDEDAFGREGALSFDWTVLYANPPITLATQPGDSSIATLTKRNGNGKMNSFQIEVMVWEEGVSQPIARYLVISDGGQLTVTPQPL